MSLYYGMLSSEIIVQHRRMCCTKLATPGNPSKSRCLPFANALLIPLHLPLRAAAHLSLHTGLLTSTSGRHHQITQPVAWSFTLHQPNLSKFTEKYSINNQRWTEDSASTPFPASAYLLRVRSPLWISGSASTRPGQAYTMPLYIRAATEADTARIGRIGRDAFRDTLSRSFFPAHLSSKSETGDPDQDEVQWRGERVMRRMREGKPTFVVVDVPDDGSDGEDVVGFAQWELPSSSTHVSEPAHESESDPLPASLDLEALSEVFAKLEAESKKALGPDGHNKIWCKVPPQTPMLCSS